MSEYTMPDPLSAASSYYEAPEKENYPAAATQKRALRRDASNGSSSALSSLFESVADRDSTFLPPKSVLSNSYSSLSEFSIIRPAHARDSLENSPRSIGRSTSANQSSRYSSGISRRGINSSAELEGLELEVTRGESPFARWEMAMQPTETTGYVSFHAEGDFRADEDLEQTKANIDPRDLIDATQSGSIKSARSFLQQRSIRYLIKASIFLIALSTFIKPLNPDSQISGDPIEPEDLVEFSPLATSLPEITSPARAPLPTPSQTLLSLSQYLIAPCLLSIASLVLLYYTNSPKKSTLPPQDTKAMPVNRNEHNICIHGARESGKSSLLHQQLFSSPTLTSTTSRRITYTKNGVVVGTTLHDAQPAMLGSASVVLLVFSLMDRASLEFVTKAIPHFQQGEVVLVGNKLDLVTPASNAIRLQARKLAEAQGLQYFEVSAAKGTNVVEMFRMLARQLRNA